MESGWPVVAIQVDTIQEQDMKVNIQVQGTAKALYQRHRAGGALLEREPVLVGQVGRDRPANDPQHPAHRLGVGGKQVAQGKGEADDPLAQRDIGTNRQDSRFVQPQAAPKGCGTSLCRIKDPIGQQGGGLGHAAGATAGAEPALLAGKLRGRPGQPLEVALVAAHPEKTVLETTARQVGPEFLVDMLGQ